jgi:DNA-3-methyladenine glycosylase
MILEVEAYDGPLDQASHAFRGRTERTSIMFGPAGFWYIYLIYGMYWMLNIVTGPEDYPAAILIRTVGSYDGPGKLTKRLGIDKRFHQKRANKDTGLWIEDRGPLPSSFNIHTTPRIGVAYAGPIWSQKPYRFIASER